MEVNILEDAQNQNAHGLKTFHTMMAYANDLSSYMLKIHQINVLLKVMCLTLLYITSMNQT